MKRIIAFVSAFILLLCLASCGGQKDDGETHQFIASYSVKSADGDFIVEVQNLGGVYEELYDEDGLYIKKANGFKMTDKDGNEITEEDLHYGSTLMITYDGTLSKNNPKTVKAFEIQEIS